MKPGQVIVCGDTHASFGYFNNMLNTLKPSIVLQCGDFGYWDRGTWIKGATGNFVEDVKPHNTKVYWCDGNHEDHVLLMQLMEEHGRDKPIEIRENIFFCPRGSTLQLPDGRNVLFMGGAYSIDKHYRKPYIDWFPEETITSEDMTRLPDMKIDIVISHTCPSFVAPLLRLPKYYYGGDKVHDPSCDYLTRVFEKYNPQRWYFGHWHLFQNLFVNDTYFQALSHNESAQRWWIPLHKEGV